MFGKRAKIETQVNEIKKAFEEETPDAVIDVPVKSKTFKELWREAAEEKGETVEDESSEEEEVRDFIEETVEEPKPTPKQVTSQQARISKKKEAVLSLPVQEVPKKSIQIIAGVLLDGGLHQYTVVTNFPLGNIGDIENP